MQKCSCGQGSAKDKSREFCHVYGSRRKCFQNMQGCGNMCKCFNCGNPYGNNQKSSEPKMERKRKRHHNTPGSSLEFLHVKGEPLASVKWTDYDNHLLQQVANIVVGIEDNCVPDYESILKVCLDKSLQIKILLGLHSRILNFE